MPPLDALDLHALGFLKGVRGWNPGEPLRIPAVWKDWGNHLTGKIIFPETNIFAPEN